MLAVPADRRARARCCGWSSRRSPRPRTRSGRRWRCGRTASTSANLGDGVDRTHIDRYFLNTVGHRVGSWVDPDRRRDDRRLRAVGPAAAVQRDAHRARPRDALRAADRAARAALPDRPGRAARPPPLINTFWAVWLPAGASAFNVVLVKRFFDNLPREIFEAARVDGAGPFRLFWSIVLPMSRPILGVVSVFAVIATWKDYLWPLLVLPQPGPPAALGPPADAPADDRAGRLHRRPDDLEPDPDRAVPAVPAAVPARGRAERRHQGLNRRAARR